MITIEEFKNEFRDNETISLNNAGMAPIPACVASRLASALTELQHYGSRVDSDWVPQIRTTRERLGQYLSAKPSEIAFTQNCATALSQVAFGFPLEAGDRVVTLDQEYASNFYPWQVACERSGASLVVVKSEADQQVNLEKLLSSIEPGVKLVAVSWVQFQTGALLDLKLLGARCCEVGAFLIVDGIQGIGQLPISFQDLPIDFLAGGSHKWLCGTNGQAFFAIKPALMKLLKLELVGSGTFNRFGTFADEHAVIETSARQFEPGGLNYLSLFSLDEALRLQMSVGVGAIAEEISRLSQVFRLGLAGLGGQVEMVTPQAQAGGITSIKLGMEVEAKFLRRCDEEQIALAKRGEFIRVSIHAFNREEQLERVIEVLRSVV